MQTGCGCAVGVADEGVAGAVVLWAAAVVAVCGSMALTGCGCVLVGVADEGVAGAVVSWAAAVVAVCGSMALGGCGCGT